jgi:AcrR family transcriptional regulator
VEAQAHPDQTFTELKEQHRREKRRLIEAAAARVFAEQGFPNTTVAEVARAAGVSPAAIYLYFSSREELLFATVLAEVDDLEARMRRALANAKTPDIALRRMMDAYFEFFADRPEGFRMLTAGLERSARIKADPDLVAEYDRRALACLTLLNGVIERGMAEGVLRQGDSWELTHAVWGAFHGILQVALSQGPERFLGYDVKRLFDRTAAALLDGIRTQ